MIHPAATSRRMTPGSTPGGGTNRTTHRKEPAMSVYVTHRTDTQEPIPVAWGRPETDACQCGTPGCSTDHLPGTDYPCETW